jgi:putative lipoic acid-binding regulatory protein
VANILEGKKLELEYPISWQYKIIGMDEDSMHASAVHILKEKPFTLTPSNKSSSGKFVSLTLEVLVYSEDERLYIYEELRKVECIKYIL